MVLTIFSVSSTVGFPETWVGGLERANTETHKWIMCREYYLFYKKNFEKKYFLDYQNSQELDNKI